jgi:hypothetical protein
MLISSIKFCSNHAAHIITNTDVIPSYVDDIVIRKPSPNGICTAKQSFQFINAENQIQLPNQGSRSMLPEAMQLMRRVWKLKNYPQTKKTFFWRLIIKVWVTCTRVGKYSNNISKFCFTCNSLENDAHLFFSVIYLGQFGSPLNLLSMFPIFLMMMMEFKPF